MSFTPTITLKVTVPSDGEPIVIGTVKITPGIAAAAILRMMHDRAHDAASIVICDLERVVLGYQYGPDDTIPIYSDRVAQYDFFWYTFSSADEIGAWDSGLAYLADLVRTYQVAWPALTRDTLTRQFLYEEQRQAAAVAR